MTNPEDRFSEAVASQYRVERELGQGGMATVYLAHDIRHDRKVAIKVLREDLAASMGSARFLREIQIAARLQHPNILPLLDSGDTDGFLYYVMPFITGQSLRERLGRDGELPVHEAVRLLVEVVDALAEAHQHGVVHRDIKPDNVMLSGRHALVADFGVAKAISEATGRNTVTTLGVAVGTPAYMSPEQAAADPHIDHRSDIYAVGVMAYEMLTGHPPFHGTTPQQVLAAHVTEVPDSVAKRRTAISPALEQVVMRCLAKRPADRFQTAEDLLHQLEALATPSTGIKPTQTRPVTAWSEPVRARRWLVPVALLGVVLAGVAVWKVMPTAPAALADVPRIQATTTGTAEVGALSPDGQRVAYSERECDGEFRCTVGLVIQDIGGVGRMRPVSGFAGIYEIGWSPDARRVHFLATSADGRFGTFVVPALGGEAPRFLGAVDIRFFGSGDSMVVANMGEPGNVTFTVNSAVDERIGGTIPVRFPNALVRSMWQVSPDGQQIALAVTTQSGLRYMQLWNRKGESLDSMALAHEEDPAGFSPTGDLVLVISDTANAGLLTIVERKVSASGKVARTPRTLLPAQQISDPRVSRAGLSYLAGPVAITLYAGSRNRELSPELTMREVTSTTANLGVLMSGDGTSLIVTRRPLGDIRRAITQVSLFPFDAGPERSLGAGIRGAVSQSRNVAADSVVFVIEDAGQLHLTQFDLATGGTRDLGTMPDTTAMIGMEVLRDGSIAWSVPGDTSGTIRVRQPSGAVRLITTPNVYPTLLEDSQFGDGLLGWGWNRNRGDSAIVFHVPPGASAGRRILQLGVEDLRGLRWATGGLIELVVGETRYTSALYRLDPSTGMNTRIGTIPLVDIDAVSFSRDGLRMSLRTAEARRDIWVAKIFSSAP
ncbi:MAG: serine/threonine-protein kinase [Gemmatimonadales bacterium]